MGALFDLSALGNIEVDLIGIVSTVSKYDIDENNKGGFLWLTKPNNGENPNILGDQIIKVTMPFEMFDFCQRQSQAGLFVFPGVFKVRASVVSGSGNKAGHRAVSIEQLAFLNITATAVDTGLGANSKKSESK